MGRWGHSDVQSLQEVVPKGGYRCPAQAGLCADCSCYCCLMSVVALLLVWVKVVIGSSAIIFQQFDN